MCHWALTSVHSLAHTCISHGPARGQTQLQANQTPLPTRKTHTPRCPLLTGAKLLPNKATALPPKSRICASIQYSSNHLKVYLSSKSHLSPCLLWHPPQAAHPNHFMSSVFYHFSISLDASHPRCDVWYVPRTVKGSWYVGSPDRCAC